MQKILELWKSDGIINSDLKVLHKNESAWKHLHKHLAQL